MVIADTLYIYSNIRSKCEVCSKFTIKTPEQRQWRHSTVCGTVFDFLTKFYLLKSPY